MAIVRRVLALIAAAMLISTVGALPVAAESLVASAGGSTLCNEHDAGSTLQEGRGSQAREKDTGQVHADLPARAKNKAPANFSATVPVYFHVITDGATGSLTNSQINAQVAVMNKTFGGREGGTDTGFTFSLAGVTRTNDASWFAISSGAEKAMKQALKQGGDNALNVYSTSGGAYLGWAYLPDVTTGNQAFLDGIVIDYATVPGASSEFAGRYDLGETLTHETGHWLNLEHTFFGGCNKTGDFVNDTPPEKTASSGCPIGKDTCKAPGDDPIHNYMDYSYDTCYTQFTPGQTQRMRDAWLFYRAP
jgi:hypothetical protein